MKAYHVLNDYSLEALTPEEAVGFDDYVGSLTAHAGVTKGRPATYYRDFHGELVYVRVDSQDDLTGHTLQSLAH